MQAELLKQRNVFKVDVANDPGAAIIKVESKDLIVDVPENIQPSLDSLLDYYADNGQKPEIKLCGNPLDIVSDFVTQIEATLPENLINNGRDVIDFMIHNLCDFSREKNVSHMTFNFVFHRNREAQIS